jgi:hypothetical protein
MQINHDLEPGLPRPGYRLIEIRCRTESVRGAKVVPRPVTNGYPDHVEARFGDLLEILETDEAVPVRLQRVVAACFAELPAERPFVNDGPVVGAVGFENRRGYEGLEDEPATDVDASDLVYAPLERYASF